MKIERINDVTGGFRLEMSLVELLVLYTLIAEEKISLNMGAFKFENPREVAKVLRDFHQKIERQIVTRTLQELQVKFFKT